MPVVGLLIAVFIVAPVKCILSVTKIYFAVSSFIIADDNIMLAVAKILNTVFNFETV